MEKNIGDINANQEVICAEPEWVVVDCDENAARELAIALGVPDVLGKLLVNRGIKGPESAKRFLNPSLEDMHDPWLLCDMDKAVSRLLDAIDSSEKILVYGDYDVDGITSTALLYRTLCILGADVDFTLPHRKRGGYDLKVPAVEEAAEKGVRLILTCDCGSRASEAIVRANELGMDVIVTDHHELPAELPPAYAVINPHRSDNDYPFSSLAGVGVAFKLAQALVRSTGFNEESFRAGYLDLLALGTIADVVPLLDENRSIVKHGLQAIANSKKAGVKTLIESAKLGTRPLTSEMVAYVLGPRINAAGRMDDASDAVRLLTTKDVNEARILAKILEEQNNDRRSEQDRILAEAIAVLETKDLEETRVLVVDGEGWNAGIIGIVAGKLCDKYNRPCILVARDDAGKTGTGSARSPEWFNLAEHLERCSDLLTRFGGHAAAAGLSLPLENMWELENRLNTIATEMVEIEECLPRIDIDAEVDLSYIDREFANVVRMMEPFGEGNTEPVFMSSDVTVCEARQVGNGDHMKLSLRSPSGKTQDCIACGQGDMVDVLQPGSRVDICYNVRFNTFNGAENVQIVGKAIRMTR